jgi:hypothetical protein
MCAAQPWRWPHIGWERSGNTVGTAAVIPRPRRPPTAAGAQRPRKPRAKRSRNFAGSGAHGAHGQRRETNRVVRRESPARVGFLAPRQRSAGQSLGSNLFEINSIWRKTGFQPRGIKTSGAGGFQLNPLFHPQRGSSSLHFRELASLSSAGTKRRAAEREILSSVTHLERIAREVRHT